MPAHSFRATLRWGDMDAYGHVNNVTFLSYLQEARVDMLGSSGNPSMLDAGVVVVRHEIDYRAPLVFRAAPIRVETRVTEVGGASFALAYDVCEDAAPASDRVTYAQARSTLSTFDLATGRPRRLTPQERELLESYRDERPGVGPAPP